MESIENLKNEILQGNCIDVIKYIPDKSINMVMTSPPYWGLRDYRIDVETVWDGDNNCEHKWNIIKHPAKGGKTKPDNMPNVGSNKKEQGGEISVRFGYETNVCPKCGAWKGQLGLELTFDLYIKHLCNIFDEVKRVLRDDGTIWVNLGDTYSGSGKGAWKNKKAQKEVYVPDNKPKIKEELQGKCLTMIPQRFAIEMINRGWILRNVIIWHKPNCMPSSVKDRFTVDFEYLFFFSKKKKYYFKQQLEPTITKDNIIRDRDKTKLNNTPGRTRMGGLNKNDYDLKNKRTIWKFPTKPFKEAHFAVYPEELCETPIKAGCPKNGMVLDPFFGVGTTGLVALKQNKKFIGIELNKEYIKIAKKRLKHYGDKDAMAKA